MLTVVEYKRESAEWSVKALVDQIRSIEAVLLFGSVARGDATTDSDIDLIIVASDPLRSTRVREALGEEHRRTSITCHTWDSLAVARREEWSFFVHLREEGEILYGGPELKRSIDRTHPPDVTIWKERLGDELERLDRFDDLARYSAGYNLPLARIFRTARYSCMLENTAAGEAAFSRDACFDVFARRHPKVSAETDLVKRLWPFHARTQGRRGPALPFEPKAETDVVEACEAARAVVGAALHG